MLLLRARTLFYYPRDWRRSNLCSETWSGPSMGCICFIHSSRKNIDPLRTKLKIEPLLTQLLWPCTDFTGARGKSAAIITQQTDQMSQPHPGVSAHLLKYCRTCSRWFDLLDCSYFPFLIIYFNMTNRWLYLIAQVACILRHAKLLQVVFFFTRFTIIFLLLFYSCHSCLEFFDTRWFMPGHSR